VLARVKRGATSISCQLLTFRLRNDESSIFLVRLVGFGYNHFLEFYVFLRFNRFGTLFNRFAYRDQCSRQLSDCTEIGGMISHFSECTSTIVKNEFLVVDSFLPCKLYQFCSLHQHHLKFWILAPPLDSYPLLESLWSERGYAFFLSETRICSYADMHPSPMAPDQHQQQDGFANAKWRAGVRARARNCPIFTCTLTRFVGQLAWVCLVYGTFV